jgi:poly-gamma-glutamate synthesis protein (capsule biosynthesis protein)
MQADYRVINLETVIAPAGKSVNHKTYIFRSDPENLAVLKYLEVQGLFLANNHTCDLGLSGIEQTIAHVSAAGLQYAGIGRNENEAVRPFIAEVQGLRIAFFSINTIGHSDTFAAKTRPGTAQPSPAFFSQLRRASSMADFVVVGVHWGNEYAVFPNPQQRELAQKLIREGAGAVIGHHPHVPQGTEFIDGRPVVYSLGNFLFGSANYQQTHNLIAVLQIDLKSKRAKAVELHPITGRYRKDGYVIDLVSEEERTAFFEEMYLLCQKLNPNQNIFLEDGMRRMVILP